MWVGTDNDLERDLTALARGGRWTERHPHVRVYKAPNGAIVRCYPNRTVHLQGRNESAAYLFGRLDRRNRLRAQKLGVVLSE